MADLSLDTQGLNCPLPILKTKKALREVALGGTLEVLATDPAADADFRAFCEASGHELLIAEVKDGVYRFVLKRTR
ncbi:MAG: sulfurtransferase TusA family protein [Gammaproteobacteria bacterium]|jgi:tRNA 2-thiouridine synthesizing protein A|nr:sulfurtransferase TusA family protein [Gammaproteobacteria bacterium]